MSGSCSSCLWISKTITARKLAYGCRTAFRPFSSTVKSATPKVWDVDSEEYQFLQRSEVSTYHFQRSLRRLPIPKLQESCRRYLSAVRPFTGDDNFKKTEQIVSDFMTNEGPGLQKALIDFDRKNRHTSYISEPWFDKYLRSRTPCPIYDNPFMALATDPQPEYNDQVLRATNLVISIARFKRSLDEELLKPEVFHLNPKRTDTQRMRRFYSWLPLKVAWYGAAATKAFALDMSQYKSMFCGSRMPQPVKDELFNAGHSRHFVVLRRGHVFAVELFDEKGRILSPSIVLASIAQIVNRPLEQSQTAIGSFTAMDRDSWANIHFQLQKSSARNVESLQKIDSAVFALCLDEVESEDPKALIPPLLIGGDGSNRWFDKTFQLIVLKNGLAAINFEHSWGDGVAVLRLLEDIVKDTGDNKFAATNAFPPASSSRVEELEFELSDELKTKLIDAGRRYTDLGDSLNFNGFKYVDMTRDTIKTEKLSPDAVMQLAIQIAFFRLYGETVPTYESASTAVFRRGRTEVVRSATAATKRCSQAFAVKDRPSVKELRALIDECSTVHSKLVREACLGQGFDRHLLGLQMSAERLGEKTPALFEDETYKVANHFTLSTSTLASDAMILGGFGPVVADGFGVGYNTVGSYLGCVVSAYTKSHSADQFAQALHQSLDDVRDVLHATKLA